MVDQLRRIENPTSMMPCSQCHIGQMHQTRATYFTWLTEDMVTVPDFPAWKCDICGHLEYDFEALSNLALLMCPAEEKPARAKTAQPTSQQDQLPITSQPTQTK